MDNVIISIEFTPCPVEQKAVYKVRYRKNPTDPFITYPGTFLTSPIILSIPTNDFSQEYEGYVDTFCSGFGGPSSYWKTGQGIAPPATAPASLILIVKAGQAKTGMVLRMNTGFVKANINWGDGVLEDLLKADLAPDGAFWLSHDYTDNTKEYTVIVSFETDGDLVGIHGVYNKFRKVSGLDSNKMLNSIILTTTKLLEISNLPPSAKEVYLEECELTSSYINQVLASLVLGGATGGLLNTIGQVPTAGPTGQGITDRQTLIQRGWTVNTD